VPDANSFCPKCAAPLPGGSAFCNRCGAPIAAGPLPAAPAPVPAGKEPEDDLWKGRFSAKAQAHWWLLWSVEVVGLLWLWFYKVDEATRVTLAARIVFAVAALLPAVYIGWTLLTSKLSVRYRLTNYRLFKESGILSRSLNEIELIRVDDVAVHQNLLQRVFNVGIVTVIAPTDPTEPRLELVGVENPIEIKELIRSQVRKRREKSVHFENL
jgi:membrane protein YdbS with pleckstrin-like domain